MRYRRTTGTRGLLAAAAVAAALTALLFGAASVSAAPIDTAGPVVSLSCQPCHADISDTKVKGIRFTHAGHILYECSACHTKFPHRPEGTTIPDMRICWSCHALRHGPQGTMAGSNCDKCHLGYKTQPKRKPKSHTAGWVLKPHVQPSVESSQTLCAMCHDRKSCDVCHDKKGVMWFSTQPLRYDPGNGCLACHGAMLPRLPQPVSGIDGSAHRDVTCTRCHPDFRYYEGADATKLWKVNAGFACADASCHPEQAKAYRGSVHEMALTKKKNYDAATCAGCHGGHTIERLKTQGAKARLQASAERSCGATVVNCHPKPWASYNDYLHGAAYRSGGTDRPSCWACHGAHDALAVKDPKSAVSPENLYKTCGKCHRGSTEAFAESTRKLIHGSAAAREENPLRALLRRVLP